MDKKGNLKNNLNSREYALYTVIQDKERRVRKSLLKGGEEEIFNLRRFHKLIVKNMGLF